MNDLRTLLRSTRETAGLSRSAVADRIAQSGASDFVTERTLQWLENECVRMPSPDVLRPVADALELDWDEVLRVAGY